jgi:L-histidine Nalpha-methyltransferase
MPASAHLTIHPSQFPDQVQRDLLTSLRTRQVNHKFHYDSVKQTLKWLALHQALSPARTDPACAAAYDRSFAAVAASLAAPQVHVIGLGCGGGQKDARLLRRLRAVGQEVFYTPVDVSAAMVLVARAAALEVIPDDHCWPLVCDLATTDDLAGAVAWASGTRSGRSAGAPPAARLVTFFGMLPNFEPAAILPRLAALVGPADALLFSANLAPGPDYAAGVRRILPLYDNALTRDWLLTFLTDLGVENTDGRLRFVIEDDPAGTDLKRVAAYFDFTRRRVIQVAEERFMFAPSDRVRLFFSYRHTPALVRRLLTRSALRVFRHWMPRSGEEGVFLAGVSRKA